MPDLDIRLCSYVHTQPRLSTKMLKAVLWREVWWRLTEAHQLNSRTNLQRVKNGKTSDKGWNLEILYSQCAWMIWHCKCLAWTLVKWSFRGNSDTKNWYLAQLSGASILNRKMSAGYAIDQPWPYSFGLQESALSLVRRIPWPTRTTKEKSTNFAHNGRPSLGTLTERPTF